MKTKLLGSVLMLLLSLAASVDAYATDYGQGWNNSGKVTICHRTSSDSNPYVLIEVATSAKSSHYAHGDPVNFTTLSGGRCRAQTPAPTVSLRLAASEINVGATTTATWTSTNATSCKIGNTTVAVNGSAPVGPYTTSGNKTVTVTCTGAGGSTSDSETLKVKSVPAPKVSLSLPDVGYVGETLTATWNSTNAASCKIGSTSVAVNGSAPVGPYSTTGSKTVTITCTGAGGSSSDSETVTIKATRPTAPVITLTLQPSTILVKTGKATLAWSSTGATKCTLSGSGSIYGYSWSFNVSTSGSYVKGPFQMTGSGVYTLTCTGPGGTSSKTVTLTVVNQQATPGVNLSLEAANNTIVVGEETLATWTLTNGTPTTVCTLSNGATASPAVVGPYTTAQTVPLTVTCVGPHATITDTETLKVLPAGEPKVQLSVAVEEMFVGEKTSATWVAEDVTSCELSNGATASPAVVGPYTVSGEVELTVSCTGPYGDVEDSVRLYINDIEASVGLTLARRTITVGETTTATWTAQNVDSCELSNGKTASPAVVGPYTTPQTVVLTVSCTGAYGDAEASDTLTVLPELPIITELTLEPAVIKTLTGMTKITWSSVDADSCTLNYGALTGPAAVVTSGTLTVGNYTEGSKRITLTCGNAAGTATANVDLLVETPELLCGMKFPGAQRLLIDFYPVSGLVLMEYADDADTLVDITGDIVGGQHWALPGTVLQLNTGATSSGSVLTGVTGSAFNFPDGSQIGFTLPASCVSIGLGR